MLNGTGRNVKVGPEKTELIRRVARELRYRPSHVARSLRDRRTGMVAVVFQHLDRLGMDHPYYPQLLNGVMSALFPAGYTLALCPRLIQGDDADSISDGRFDGVLWCRPDFTEGSLEAIQNSNVPVVVMHAPPGAVPGIPTFCADNEGAMRKVVRHLTELGHSRLEFVIDPVTRHTVEGRVRREAFFGAVREAGLGEAASRVWDAERPDVLEILRASAPPTALVCFSDTVAGSIVAACDRYGVLVPRDLSVVGFDSSSFCEGTRPRLTSVNQPVERIAQAATLHLLDLVRRAEAGSPVLPAVSSVYDCGLDVRESTAAPRSSPTETVGADRL